MNSRMPLYWMTLSVLFSLPACAAPPKASDYPRIATYALQDTADTRLGRAYASAIRSHPGRSGFHLLINGPEALMMHIALIEDSQRSIDIQCFSPEEDNTGTLLLEAMIRAAHRGVRVRLLIDDWNIGAFEAGAAVLNATPNIEIRVFNPYAMRNQSVLASAGDIFSFFGRYAKRMHNKAIIIDNQVAIMGGRNLGDEYFDAGKYMNFRDAGIFSVGRIARQISRNFDRYWNSEASFPLSTVALPPPNQNAAAGIPEIMERHWQAMLHSPIGKRLKELPLPHEAKKGEAPLIWAKAELAADSPDKINQDSDKATSKPAEAIRALAGKARHEFIIITPYFVPLDDGVKWLDGLAARGVHVRVITNSLASTDMVPAEAGYSHYREALVKGGIELYELKSSVPPRDGETMFKPSLHNGLHSKIYMIDRRDLVIGSFNFDARSMRMNTEQVLVIHSPALCAQVAQLFGNIISPRISYHVISASDVPEQDQSLIHGALAWETKENGHIVYYDFNPHVGFWRRLTGWFFSLLPIDDEL